MGVCGSGSKEDCKGVCNGAHAILCAKSAYFNINWDDCTVSFIYIYLYINIYVDR